MIVIMILETLDWHYPVERDVVYLGQTLALIYKCKDAARLAKHKPIWIHIYVTEVHITDETWP